MTLTRTQRPEHLDQLEPGAADDALAGNLRDIRRANHWFGGTRAVLDAIATALDGRPPDEAISILDVATGSADIPVAVAKWSEKVGRDVRIVASDLQPGVLAFARAAERPSRVSVERANALALPYPDGAFDVVTLALALHHFEPDAAVRVLREMGRVGRLALIVSDLERSRIGYAGAWLFAHLLTTNRMTRNDAPLSVRRSYTAPEALALAHTAGWHGARARRRMPFRFVLTGRPA